MKIVCVGDVYGKTGRHALQKHLQTLKDKYSPHWIIVNGENITAGNGVSQKHYNFMMNLGIDIITTGNHTFARNDWRDVVQNPNILRPHNILPEVPCGTGWRLFNKDGVKGVAVVNLAGRVFMDPAYCPFKCFDEIYLQLPKELPIIVDFHGEATSEKLAFFWYVNKRASLVFGTHTHVQTSDEMILPGEKTACITDLGMTGAVDGVIGVNKEVVIGRFKQGYSDKFLCANGDSKLEGIFVEFNEDNSPINIERIRIKD
jgi:metallophosphoesterase (TIGR00282 family)